MHNITVVYLPGVGFRSWIWDEVAAKIPGTNIAVDYAETHQSLADYVDQVMAEIDASEAERVVLVGHSASGTVEAEVARRLEDKLTGLVAVSATIPRPGKSFFASLPVPQRFVMPLLVGLLGTKAPESMIRASTKDVEKPTQDRIVAEFRTDSKRLFRDRTASTPLPTVPSLYIVTTRDDEFSATYQEAQAAQLPNAHLEHIASGHMPMLTHADELASHLRQFVEKL